MTTLYLVRSDDYEDTSTVAIFTDEATATHYRETLDPSLVVEEITLNEWTPASIAAERVRLDEDKARQDREHAERRATYEQRRAAGEPSTYQDMMDSITDMWHGHVARLTLADLTRTLTIGDHIAPDDDQPQYVDYLMTRKREAHDGV